MARIGLNDFFLRPAIGGVIGLRFGEILVFCKGKELLPFLISHLGGRRFGDHDDQRILVRRGDLQGRVIPGTRGKGVGLPLYQDFKTREPVGEVGKGRADKLFAVAKMRCDLFAAFHLIVQRGQPVFMGKCRCYR